AELIGDAEPVPNPAEVESVHWFTPAEMAVLPDALPSNFEFLEALEAGQIDLHPGPSRDNAKPSRDR
ncbi:MAG: hypothetical protein JW888_01045, partial [Pirellulales bacterium]|nr:hypothetical protein [Pirellulales bacterium]